MPDPPLTAYRVSIAPEMDIVPAPLGREWMAETNEAFANRCLPLLIANQAGWLLLNPAGLRATWTGGPAIPDLVVEPTETTWAAASSHFGHGILTFTIPYLFRTPPGMNLLVRGPANLPKDGVYALDGLIETDWCPATFTMNWKLTRPGTVEFAAREPIAMIVPMRRGELEALDPEIRPLDSSPEVSSEYRAWRKSRADFLVDLPIPGTEAHGQVWQKDYVHGRRPDGTAVDEHQRKLSLRPFRRG